MLPVWLCIPPNVCIAQRYCNSAVIRPPLTPSAFQSLPIRSYGVQYGWTALIEAAQNGHVDAMKLMACFPVPRGRIAQLVRVLEVALAEECIRSKK